jgi:hypothetical protein
VTREAKPGIIRPRLRGTTVHNKRPSWPNMRSTSTACSRSTSLRMGAVYLVFPHGQTVKLYRKTGPVLAHESETALG